MTGEPIALPTRQELAAYLRELSAAVSRRDIPDALLPAVARAIVPAYRIAVGMRRNRAAARLKAMAGKTERRVG